MILIHSDMRRLSSGLDLEYSLMIVPMSSTLLRYNVLRLPTSYSFDLLWHLDTLVTPKCLLRLSLSITSVHTGHGFQMASGAFLTNPLPPPQPLSTTRQPCEAIPRLSTRMIYLRVLLQPLDTRGADRSRVLRCAFL